MDELPKMTLMVGRANRIEKTSFFLDALNKLAAEGVTVVVIDEPEPEPRRDLSLSCGLGGFGYDYHGMMRDDFILPDFKWDMETAWEKVQNNQRLTMAELAKTLDKTELPKHLFNRWRPPEKSRR
jgi:hypothetical protein